MSIFTKLGFERHAVVSLDLAHSLMWNVHPQEVCGVSLSLGRRRYRLLRDNPVCARCGLRAAFYAIERHAVRDRETKRWKAAERDNNAWHLNLYVVVEGKEIQFTLDHVVPRSRGGSDSPDNLQTMCQPCNTAKAHRLEDESDEDWRVVKEATQERSFLLGLKGPKIKPDFNSTRQRQIREKMLRRALFVPAAAGQTSIAHGLVRAGLAEGYRDARRLIAEVGVCRADHAYRHEDLRKDYVLKDKDFRDNLSLVLVGGSLAPQAVLCFHLEEIQLTSLVG